MTKRLRRATGWATICLMKTSATAPATTANPAATKNNGQPLREKLYSFCILINFFSIVFLLGMTFDLLDWGVGVLQVITDNWELTGAVCFPQDRPTSCL